MKHRIQPGAWKLGQRIGQGSFGEVYVGMDTKRGQLIAVKALVLGSVRLSSKCDRRGTEASLVEQDEEASTSLLQEIQLMKNLEHPNIVRYLGAEVSVSVSGAS